MFHNKEPELNIVKINKSFFLFCFFHVLFLLSSFVENISLLNSNDKTKS